MPTLFSLNDGNLTDSNVFGQTLSSADLFNGPFNLNVSTSYGDPSINAYSITSDGSTLSAVAINVNFRAVNPTGTLSMMLSSGASYVTETYAISSFTPYDDRNNLISTLSQNWQILKLTVPFPSAPGSRIRLDFLTSDPNQLSLVGLLTAFEDSKDVVGTFNGTFSQTDSPFLSSPLETSYVFDSSRANQLNFAGYNDTVFGTGDFTIELWFKINSTATYYPLIMKGNGYNANPYYSHDWHLFWNGDKIWFTRYADVESRPSFAYTPTVGVWTHIAICRKNGVLTPYINGVGLTPEANTVNYFNYTNHDIQIGASVYGGAAWYLNGSVTNARVIAGKALYLKNFTVPTSPLALDSGSTTANYKSPTSPTYVGEMTPFTGVGAEDGSLYFNGTNDYLPIPKSNGFDFPSGSFTIEAWVQFDDLNNHIIASNYLNTVAGWTLQYYDSKFGFYGAGNPAHIRGTTNIQSNTWYHITVAGSPGSYKMFLNGVQEGETYTGALSLAGGALNIGTLGTFIQNYHKGYISNLRIVNGTALYTSNFAVPTSPLSNIANTSLLLKAPYYPLSRTANDLTPFTGGNAEPSSLFFNGTDFLQFPSSPNFNFVSGIFTVECWVRFTSVGSNFLLSNHSTSTNGWALATYNSLFYFSATGDGIDCIGTTTIQLNTWYHVAFGGSPGSYRLFVNGVQEGGTYTGSTVLAGGTFYVGKYYGNAYYFNGYMSNARIVNGTALYTSNFAVPTAPLTNIPNTVYLLRSPYEQFNFLLSNQSPFGVGTDSSIRFNGTSDYLTIPHNTSLNLAGAPFTIECWINFNGDVSIHRDIFTKRVTSSNSTSYQGYIQVTSQKLSFWNGSVEYVSSYVVPVNTWVHTAWVYDGTSITIYANGVNVGSFNVTIVDNTEPLILGYRRGYTTHYVGYISNFRVVKGTALYTSNFTPSTSPLSAVAGTVFLMKDAYDTRFDVRYSTPFLLGSYGSLNKGLITTTTKNPSTFIEYGTLTKTGSPTLSSASPFGIGTDSSIYFSDSNFVVVPTTTNFGMGTGDFTFEFWARPTTTASYATMFVLGVYNTGIVLRINEGGGGWLSPLLFGGGGYNWGSTNLVKNVWSHVAFVRRSNVVTIYINGTSVFTVNPGVVDFGASNQLYIGSSPHEPNTEGFDGFISNFRVVKGTAVYTANFTPPTSPLTVIPNTVFLYNHPYGNTYSIKNAHNLHIGGSLTGLTSEARTLTASSIEEGNIYIHNGGKLTFPQTNTTITVVGSQGLQITSDGTLEIGTANNPISSAVQHSIVLNNSQIDVHNGGNMNVYGAYKKPYTYLTADSVSAVRIFTVVDTVSANWSVGDSVVFTPNTFQANSFDVLTLSSFDSGSTFRTTASAAFPHPSVTSLGNVPTVSNLSRNISICGGLSSSRATVRAVDAAKVNIANTQFTNFGIASANKTGFVAGVNPSGYITLSGNSFNSDGFVGTTHIATISSKPTIGNVTLRDNVFFRSGGNGVSLSLVSATALTVTGNTLLNSASSGLFFASVSSSRITMSDNTVIGARSNGTFIVNSNINGNIAGVLNYRNGNSGLVLSASQCGSIDNIISIYNIGEGIYIDGSIPGLSNTTFSNITASNNAAVGFRVSGNTINLLAPITLNINRLVANNNLNGGFECYAITGNLSSMTLNNNIGYGINTSIGNGATTFDGVTSVGTSPGSSLLTKTGSPTLSSASPFGAGVDSSIYFFDSNYITVPSNNLNTDSNDFTLECWFRLTASGSYYTIFSYGDYRHDNGILCRVNNGGTGDIFSANTYVGNWGAVPLNQWHHLAICRISGSFKVYLNGFLRLTATIYTSSTIRDLYIGASPHTGFLEGLNGNISNFRIVKNTALYTSDFTVPTSPLLVTPNMALLYNHPYGPTYQYVSTTPSAFGILSSFSSFPVTIKNLVLNTTYYAMSLDSTEFSNFYVDGSVLSGGYSSLFLQSTRKPVQGSYMFHDTKSGPTLINAMSNYQNDVHRTAGFVFTNMNNTTSSITTYLQAGTRTKDYATTSNAIGVEIPTERLTPQSAFLKLRSGSKFLALNANDYATVSVYIKISSDYNGSDPRLMLKHNGALGINENLVLKTIITRDSDFIKVSSKTPRVTETGVLEVYVDCDGNRGSINIDNWTVTYTN